MEIFKRTDTGMRSLLVAAALVVVISGLRASQALVVPLLASAMIAILFLPAMSWLQRRRLPDWLALTIVLTGVLALFSLVTMGVGKSIADFNERLPQYTRDLTERYGDSLAALKEKLEPFGVSLSIDGISEQFDPSAALNYFGNVAGAAADLLSNTFLIVLTVAFVLGEAAGFPRKLLTAFGEKSGLDAESAEAVASVRSYLRIKTELSLATGSLATLLVALVGVDFPFLWGSLAFVLNFVPNVGSIIAAIPPMLLAFVQFGWQEMVVVGVGYAAINTVIGNVIEPRLMGRKLGLSSLVVWLSLVFWGWVWGPIGMLLSVPLTMLLKLLLERSDDLRWVAVLLGPADEAPAPAAAELSQAPDEYDALGSPPAPAEAATAGPNDD
jgi:predicted PurR-regulated permease PerM